MPVCSFCIKTNFQGALLAESTEARFTENCVQWANDFDCWIHGDHLCVGAVFIFFSLNTNWRFPTMTYSNAAPSSNDTKANPNGAANLSTSNDYINHYLSGNPIIYIYKVTDYVDRDTGAITWFYNGNIKSGKKDGNNYISVEGTLSERALTVLKPMIAAINSGDPLQKRSVGITAKTPRFEGVSAFTPKGTTEPVGVARFRINTILDMRVFQKESGKAVPNSNQPAEENKGERTGSYPAEQH